MSEVPISSLPLEISADAAVEAAYRTDLEWISRKLSQGLSVLVECDKQLTTFIYRALRQRLGPAGGGRTMRLVSGHHRGGDGPGAMQTLMQRLLTQLQEAVFSGAQNEIIVLPHLDILTTTTRSGLSAETREAAALLHENPDAVFLGFKDPSFELPKVIENVFTARVPLIGLARERLPMLITRTEARKLAVETFNPCSLYKYVSGLNAVRLRQILSHFTTRLDCTPDNPGARDAILHEIRQMTVVSDVELPRVDLEKDIGGYAKVKEKLRREILDLLSARDSLTDPEAVRSTEELIPKGIIFHGPPGTGKTFFAKAIASSIDATLTVVSGPELKSKWVGESEENLRSVFARARRSAPAIIVFDELDSFASARGTYAGSGVEHSMVNQMLTEMDGFRKEEMVFVIGTTNFMESLDSALLRPGRFELAIHIPTPDEDDRRAILRIYRERFALNLPDDVLDHAAQKMSGFADERSTLRYSGDHIQALARALKREVLRRGEPHAVLTTADVDKALNRTAGERKLQAREEATIAAHEAGHAVLAYVLPHCPTIEKITIATGEEDTLGYVMQAVRKNKYVTTEEELLDDICVLLGGREAERLLFGRISVGAYSDLQRANEIARLMVEELAMGTRLGSRTVSAAADRTTGAMGGARRAVSEEVAGGIDADIAAILDAQLQRARSTLAEHRGALEALRDLLLEKKTLGLAELKPLFQERDFKSTLT